MNPNRLPLVFSLDRDHPLDTLEAILAIARRGNVHLTRLQVERTEVAMELGADDPDLLSLFSARLHNVIGIYDIRLSESFTFSPQETLALC
ncbi:hypothetical protein [Massilia sp. CF038]|uniref:hypothetical protein n=1 Tax=Massilia sp. CF038 TaxID=1881045 RepID=UPI000919E704|nr:hypothetical protein [Massilia sp. CF038]SHG46254.1 hypothetical protein SAMN05428948_0591 [Massilia sp. CF038]